MTKDEYVLNGLPHAAGDDSDLPELKREITRELAAFIHGNGQADWTDLHKLLDDIQPPATVARLAAEAAAAVLIAFERGYRMEREP